MFDIFGRNTYLRPVLANATVFALDMGALLAGLTVPRITLPERYAAVIAKGDELVDWREMCGRYPGATIRLLEGGDHALSDFESHLPFVLDFLRLRS